MSVAADLDHHRYISLATFRRTGAEIATPVWFAALGARLYVFTAGESGKVKRLRHTPRARVAPANARGGLRGAWQPATARLVTDAGLIQRAHAAFRSKYGLQGWVADAFSRLMGRLERRAWIELELE